MSKSTKPDTKFMADESGVVHAWTGYISPRGAAVGYCGSKTWSYSYGNEVERFEITCKRCLAVMAKIALEVKK